MSYRGESRGRGVSNAPAWMSKDREYDQHHPDGLNTQGPPRDHHRRPPPQRYDPRSDRRHDRDYDDRRSRGGGGGRSSSSRRRASSNRSGVYFGSYEEERAWVEERRRRRHERKSLFDMKPTPEQMALEELQKAALASSGPNPNVFLRPDEMKVKQSSTSTYEKNMMSSPPVYSRVDASSLQPQQTRHARRLYVGNLPVDLTENDVHDFFRSAIHTAMGEEEETAEDHIMSVYINKERRFAFLEFHSIDVCTACLALDGIDVCNKGKVKVKRPNDYNPSMAPSSDPEVINQFNASKLGIISTTVPDSKNKIFIGGLPYHLTENEVLELLRAFGDVKAFHLVKADAMASTSKGYCFVEYVDENVKDVAVMGLNGMDMGNGKQLSAKIATTTGSSSGTGHNSSGISGVSPIVPSVGMQPIGDSSAPPIMKVVDGVDIEALVDVAMGRTSLSSAANNPTAVVPNGLTGSFTQQNTDVPAGVLDIANAALAAAYGHNNN